MVDYQPYVDRVDALVTGRPGTVIVAFLLVTVPGRPVTRASTRSTYGW